MKIRQSKCYSIIVVVQIRFPSSLLHPSINLDDSLSEGLPQVSMMISKTLYFGYGSNLWKEQMRLRCPSSTYKGVGCLHNYRWIINERGYANVVPSKPSSSSSHPQEVYGLIYSLGPSDERSLDRNEGVPHVYGKEMISIQYWSATSDEPIDISSKPELKAMLVYVDYDRIEEAKPKQEYIHRMNEGIQDALAAGIPKDYVDTILRRFIPPETEDGEDAEGTRQMARKQAESFEDE